MTPVNMSDPVYHDEYAARAHLEAVRWPNGVICPHCEEDGKLGDKARPLNGDSMGDGWFYCPVCQDKFTVRTKTVWERSHIPLHKWLLASRLMASSKKGISAHQLHRTLEITYKSAWFLAHRLRESMKDAAPTPLGGKGRVIEADETFLGPAKDVFSNEKGWQKERGTGGKLKVLTLVERRGGAKSVHIPDLTLPNIRKIVLENSDTESRLHTDEANHYKRLGKKFEKHEAVNHHKGEYVRGDVTTNNVEGYFSIFKRGMIGVYQHCSEKHIQRYLHEFDFRFTNRISLGIDDSERTTRVLKGAAGKRLRYRGLGGRKAA